MPTEKDEERARDKTVEDTFPASDPPANSGITGAEPPGEAHQANTDAEPKGRPTSDRHNMETAYHREDQGNASPGEK